MNIENLSIEQLVELREQVNTTLSDRVAARQNELEAEVAKLATLTGKPSQKRSVKYRDGKNEWAGTGAMPGWLSAKKALGEDVEKYRV